MSTRTLNPLYIIRLASKGTFAIILERRGSFITLALTRPLLAAFDELVPEVIDLLLLLVIAMHRYGTLEAALNAGRFPAQAQSLRLDRSIAPMNRSAALPSLRNQKPTWRKAADLARDWELNQLAKRLEELASG
jgi:hypothetical protein